MGWVVLNREVEYLQELRHKYQVPAFCVTTDHEEVGRIQGQQFSALLPNGGTVLYIQGPGESPASKLRTKGMMETKPANIEIRALRAQWTLESSKRAVQAWLQLATSRDSRIDAVGCQDDSMALGARAAFGELEDLKARERWLGLPYTGCDGLRTTGQKWVNQSLLAATIVIPANSGLAIELLVLAKKSGRQPLLNTSTKISSYPAIDTLGNRKIARAATPVYRAPGTF